ncbi:hypothetical protein [Seleniivibrio woodruffii]|uniref:Replication initiation factor n=2 Tax=Seleniivibrio woodruffii TaxID=1078050 RepID=A0A4R1K9N9_9BACT|nr:hypothetical protein [Seleniivibrio woodruffii]TCK60750.1 hypothetical protein C8D98_1629 [Seleniivibrio woodruffii]TVZ36380.1 hypothetical protein OF66_2005 [Seleniivibrio woodruffii]
MIVHYGFDRLKVSVSNYVFRTTDLEGLEPKGMSNGFRWFSNAKYALGISDGYCVIEFFSLWFITEVSTMSEVWPKVSGFLSDMFERYENPRISRVDVFADYTGDSIEELTNEDYRGKSKTKTGKFSGDTGTETSYLFNRSHSWTVRRYDKSREISDNMTGHRYDPEYASGVIRIEAEYQKDYLKNLKERSFKNCIAFIIKHLRECRPVELGFLADRLEEEIGGGVIQYKASTTGQHTGQRTKERIYKALALLHGDFRAITGGDDTEFYAELAKLGRKAISIHV